MKLYHQYNSARKKENDFLDYIFETYPQIEYIKENYDLSKINLETEIDLTDTLKFLQNDRFLPLRKKNELINILKNIPEKIKVIKTSSDISVDFVFVSDSKPYFIELHEKQHKKLTVSRMQNIYTVQCETIKVPRFAQRFIRDLWRIRNLPNLTIIWYDWFLLNKEIYNFEFSLKFKEYFLDQKFSFTNFNNNQNV